MRFRTEGEVPRLDVEPLLDLVPALLDEWAALAFDRTGRLLHAETGEVVPGLVLVEGVHPRGTYRAELAPTMEGDAPTPVRIAVTRFDRERVDLTVADERDHWSADVVLDRLGSTPSIALVGRLSITKVLREQKLPGCLAGLLGGQATLSATLDAAPVLGRGRDLLVASGRANRFPFDARLRVDRSTRRWDVDGLAHLHARGLGRLVLLFARKAIREAVDRDVERWWRGSEGVPAGVDLFVKTLRSGIEEIGRDGAKRVLHDALWMDREEPR